MAEPRKRDMEEVSVTMVGDMASALQIASYQRRSYGDENCDVAGLVEEAVSDWLQKEIYGPTPVDKEPTPEPVQPVGIGKVARSGQLAMVMVLSLVLLSVIGWSLVKSAQRDEVEAFVPAAGPETVAAAPVATGILIIDAQPWAEVRGVRDESGLEVALPQDRTTPLRLELPTGLYRVSLLRPGSDQLQSCEAQLADSSIVKCMPGQGELDTTGYFKQTGWWR